MSFINPFHELDINESERHPNAHTLRGGFLQKIVDTFVVFAGRVGRGVDYEYAHLGLFDYALLMLPIVITIVNLACMQTAQDKKRNPVLRFIAGFACIFTVPVDYICIGLRYLFAIIGTLLASITIIPLVQAVSWVASYSRKQEIEHLDVYLETVNGEISSMHARILGSLLTGRADLNTMKIDYVCCPAYMQRWKVVNATAETSEGEYNYHSTKLPGDTLYLFKEGIVCAFHGNSDKENTYAYQVWRFPKNESHQELQNLPPDEVLQKIKSDPQRYMPPYLLFKSRDGTAIAYTPINEASLMNDKNRKAIQAMLELNVGGLANKFNRIPDENFKNHFSEERSAPKA